MKFANHSQSEIDEWRGLGHRRRCNIVAAVRHEIAEISDELVGLCQSPQRVDPVETVSSELIPLCAALKFVGRCGPSILRSKRVGPIGQPIWLWGVQSKIERVARGDILVLAAWNYPLLLPGVQTAQALAAGNRVFLKPAPGCESVTQRLADLFHQAGVPPSILQVLPSATESAIELIAKGVDLVVLTGASSTGRAVLRQCAEKLTPTILELSGCDAVIVGKDANIERTAKAIRFGLLFNGGATCIGPRRIIVSQSIKTRLAEQLKLEFQNRAAVTIHETAVAVVHELVDDTLRRGGTNLLAPAEHRVLQTTGPFPPIIFDNVAADWPIANRDLFAPIASLISFDDDSQAIEIVNQCRYRLAASVFGSHRWAASIASRLDVGTVTINDLVFPTADPRLPFGGRGESGFGVTRGAQGLLDMTTPRVIASHWGPLFLHLAPRRLNDLATLASLLTVTHGRMQQKWAALRRLGSGVKFKAEPPQPPKTPNPMDIE